MSDTSVPFEGGEQAELDLAPGGEEVEVQASESVEVPTEPERTYFDPTTLEGQYAKVKVQGEEIEVPVTDLPAGYMRNEDYTRKTQEAAELRREAEQALAIQNALRTNPAMTMQILAQQAGMSVEEYLGLQTSQAQQALEEQEYMDPLERQLAEERQARLDLEARINQQESDRRLQGAINGLKQEFSIDDNDVREVVQVAAQNGYGIDALPMVYRAIAYERQVAAQQAQQQSAEARQIEEQRRQAAAAAASSTVSTGTGAVGTTTEVPADGSMSMREAIEAAFEQSERAAR